MLTLVSFPHLHQDFHVWAAKGGSDWSEQEMLHQARVFAWDEKGRAAAVVENGKVIEVCDAEAIALLQSLFVFLNTDHCNNYNGCVICNPEECPEASYDECERDNLDNYADSALADADDMDGDAGSALASAGFGTDEDYGSFGDFNDE